MDLDVRLKILSRMAQSETESAKATVAKEIEAAAVVLEKETDYARLDDSLAILKTVGLRQSDVAVLAIIAFVNTVERRTLTYSEEPLMVAALKDYRAAETLLARAIETLVVFRYWQTVQVLNALIPLSKHTLERVRKKALNGLELLSKYDIDVFYGDKEHGGIGAAPQQMILDELERQSDLFIQKYLPAVLALLDNLLSPEMESAAWSYNSLKLTRAGTPPDAGIPGIRERTIDLLKRTYPLAADVKQKLHVIGVLTSATRTARVKLRDEARDMFAQNARVVLEFFTRLVAIEDLQIVQKIEHNSYWIHYHAVRDDVRVSALLVKDAIARNTEYQVYRDLIGFEGIFGDWGAPRNTGVDADAVRRAKVCEYAKSIDASNYPEWRARILKYAETESDDLATFPVFYHFFETFAAAQPKLAFRLLSEDAKQIDKFLIPLLRGLWNGPERPAVAELIKAWACEGRYLYASVKQFLANQGLDIPLLETLLHRAAELGDSQTIGQVVSVAVSNFGENHPNILSELMLPAIELLTGSSDASWVFDIWFRKEMQGAIGALDGRGTALVMANLATLKKIDYHAEKVLNVIASKEPEKVFRFLFERLRNEQGRSESGDQRFEAIPYELHELKESLSRIPAAAVGIVREQYDGNYGMLIHGGARLLKIVFPDFPAEFEAELLRLVREGGEPNLEIVLAVLRNFEGQPFIHSVAKEIARSITVDSPFRSELAVALESTGVVRGEHGVAEAYDRKRAEISTWLNEPDEKVREFVQWYSATLEAMSAAERKRSDESIVLRKFQYGEG